MMNETEGLAAIRILIAVAKADGKLLDEERNALEHALGDTTLPNGITLDTLLRDDVDLEEQIQRVVSPLAKRETFQAAVGLAYIDGECSESEEKILERLKFAFGVEAEKSTFWKELAQETKDTLLPSHIKAVKDAKERSFQIREDTLKYSIMSAVLGAFPVPGVAIATDIAVVALQAKLVRDIAQYYGSSMDKKGVSSLLGGIVGGAGMRIAVNNLMKLVPGWGSVVGATTSFATTWGVGVAAEKYFESGGKLDQAALKEEFKAAKKDGAEAYSQNKATVEAKAAKTKVVLQTLSADLEAKRITQAEYDEKVAELV